MSFIDLFRPKWRHSDADVRAEAVRALGVDQLEALVTVARKDADARVRRIAVKRLDDPRVLADIAARDPDSGIRELAGEKAAGLLVAAACGEGGDASGALTQLSAERDLGEVARRAARPDVRTASLARISDARILVEVVRRAELQDQKLAALARISDPTVLKELALEDESKAVALAALARVGDRAALEEIAKGAKVKAARTAAKERLPEEKSAATSAGPARAPDRTRRALLMQLAVTAEGVALRSDWDTAAAELKKLRERLHELEGGDETLEKRFADAVKKFETRWQADVQAKARAAAEAAAKRAKAAAEAHAQAPAPAPVVAPEPVVVAPAPPPEPTPAPAPRPPSFEALVLEAEKTATGKVSDARLADLDRRWREAGGAEAEEALRARFDAARAAMAKMVDEERARREAKVAEARAKLERACVELERKAEGKDVRGGEAALRAAQGLLKGDGDPELKTRLRAAVDKLVVKLGELREAESWKRFAAVPKLEELCKEAEALAEVLAEVEDKRRAPNLLKDLQARWKAAGAAPKEKHDLLWARFKAASDAIYEKSKEYFGKLDEERGGNLIKKEELVAKVDALKDSTAWKETSEQIKKLQEEWKAIGPVPQEKTEEIWRRFRAACDHFFDARKLNDKSRDEERAANQARKEAILARVEGLATSTDWKQTAELIKAAQDDWQQVGPVPRADADALWKRFRAACDSFFAARKAAFERADGERQENLAKKLLLCERVEALAAADDHVGALATVKELQAEWKDLGPVPREQSDEIWRRFRAACDVIYSGRDSATVEEVQAVNATGVSGFANKLPLEGLVAKLGMAAEGDAAGESPKPKKKKDKKDKPAEG